MKMIEELSQEYPWLVEKSTSLERLYACAVGAISGTLKSPLAQDEKVTQIAEILALTDYLESDQVGSTL